MASALDGLTDTQRGAAVALRSRALDGLSDAQRDAVTHSGSPLLVIGGPGTGKTEVLLRRLVWLADGGLAPHTALVLSAQTGLRERIELALERPHEELAVYSVPQFCVSLLCAEGRHVGIEPFVDVLGPGDRLAMLLDRADELELRHHDFRGRPLALFAGFVRRIDQLKADLIDAGRYAAWAASIDGDGGERELEFAGVMAAHDRMLEELGCFDEGCCATTRSCAAASPRATPCCWSTTGRTARTASASWSARSSWAAAN
jgi:DNA helicase-2/ATP-dependent DNA helicase PcrA